VDPVVDKLDGTFYEDLVSSVSGVEESEVEESGVEKSEAEESGVQVSETVTEVEVMGEVSVGSEYLRNQRPIWL
jgi:hypothetical protein